MKIKKMKDCVKLPTKTHVSDIGLDTYIPNAFTIEPFETKVLGLGIAVAIPEGCAGLLVPRSSMAKKGLIMQTSIIDPGYTGEIHLIVTNCSNKTQSFEKDDRLCSLVMFNVLNAYVEEVEDLENTSRGQKGLGSSGK